MTRLRATVFDIHRLVAWFMQEMPRNRAREFKTAEQAMKPIRKIVETVVYVIDLDKTIRFYRDLLGFRLHGTDPARHAFFQVGESMFLTFLAEATEQGGSLPPHGTRGAGHVAFGIDRDELDEWREKLTSAGVAIELEYTWPHGGQSLYFRDPSHNSVELVTPGVWGLSSGW